MFVSCSITKYYIYISHKFQFISQNSYTTLVHMYCIENAPYVGHLGQKWRHNCSWNWTPTFIMLQTDVGLWIFVLEIFNDGSPISCKQLLYWVKRLVAFSNRRKLLPTKVNTQQAFLKLKQRANLHLLLVLCLANQILSNFTQAYLLLLLKMLRQTRVYKRFRHNGLGEMAHVILLHK